MSELRKTMLEYEASRFPWDRETAEKVISCVRSLDTGLAELDRVLRPLPACEHRLGYLMELGRTIACLYTEMERPIYAKFPKLTPDHLKDDPKGAPNG